MELKVSIQANICQVWTSITLISQYFYDIGNSIYGAEEVDLEIYAQV